MNLHTSLLIECDIIAESTDTNTTNSKVSGFSIMKHLENCRKCIPCPF